MCEKLRLLDDYISELVDYSLNISWEENKISVLKNSDSYAIKKIKNQAKKLGVNFITKKDSIEFFLKSNVKQVKSDYKNFIEILKSFKDYHFIKSFLNNGREILIILNSYDEDLNFMKDRILKIAKKNDLFIKKVTDLRIVVTY